MDKGNIKAMELPIIAEGNYEEQNESIYSNDKKEYKKFVRIKEYYISQYDDMCEDYAKIEKLLPVKINLLYIYFSIL